MQRQIEIDTLENEAAESFDFASIMRSNGKTAMAEYFENRAWGFRYMAMFKRLFYRHRVVNNQVVVTDEPLRHSSQPWSKVDRVFVINASGETIVVKRC